MPAAGQSSGIANGAQTEPFELLALPHIWLALAEACCRPKWKVAGPRISYVIGIARHHHVGEQSRRRPWNGIYPKGGSVLLPRLHNAILQPGQERQAQVAHVGRLWET
jgi:hypothetical protein